jgi:hypothetical protein
MKWGETQNLFSVIIGLNLAYYAFRELRNPYLTSLKPKVEDLDEKITKLETDLSSEREWNTPSKVPDTYGISKELWTLQQDLFETKRGLAGFYAVTSGRRFDNLFGIPAITVGVLATVVLIVSTAKYEDMISPYIFYPFVFVGFVPVVALLLINYLSVMAAAHVFERKYHLYHNRFHSIYIDRYLDHALTVQEAKYHLSRGTRSSAPSSESP